MLKAINILAWTAAIAVIVMASLRMGQSEDSRTQVIIIDGSSSSPEIPAGETTSSDLAKRTGIFPHAGPDEGPPEGSESNSLAVLLNDSGAVALSQGMIHEAVGYFNRALDLDSNYARAYYNLGVAYQTLNRLDGAVKAYSEAIRLQPNYFEPAFNLGCLYSDIGDYDKGIYWLTAAIKVVRGDRSVPAHLNLGNDYRKIGEVEKAEASYREALRYRPGFVEPRFNLGLLFKSEKRYAEAVAEFQKVEALGYRPPKLYRNLGICYGHLDSLARSAAAYEQWAALDSTAGGAWYNLAIAKARLGDTARALEAYASALVVDSTHYQAAFNLARLFSRLDLIDSARAYYSLATHINPSYSRAFYNLALTFSKEGRYDSAASYYSRVIELDPENDRARFNLGLAYRKHGETELAAEVYRSIVDRNPTNNRALNNLGTALLDLKEYDSANWCFNRVVKLTGEPEAYFNRAKSYHRLDSLERAKADYREAIRLRPDYGAARHNLAILEEKAGNFQQAVALLEKAIEYGDQDWKRYWKLGQIYVKLGETEKARAAYASAARSKPESDKFRREYDSIFGKP